MPPAVGLVDQQRNAARLRGRVEQRDCGGLEFAGELIVGYFRQLLPGGPVQVVVRFKSQDPARRTLRRERDRCFFAT